MWDSGVPHGCYRVLQRLIRAPFDHHIPGCHPRNGRCRFIASQAGAMSLKIFHQHQVQIRLLGTLHIQDRAGDVSRTR